MNIFKGQNLLEFSERFKTDLDCKKYLSEIKWNYGFKCVQCGHKACQGRKDFSGTCNICSHTESATANTLFLKVKFGVRKAFFICFEMSISTKSLSTRYTAVRYQVTQNTARLLFMHKVREAMESSGKCPMDGIIHVDEFVLSGVEQGKKGRSYCAKKNKALTAVQLTKEGKVRRMYAMGIEDFSARSLESIFAHHISKSAKITTDKLFFPVTGWKVYRPIAKDYNIKQMESKKGLNFVSLNTMNYQIKSWIRTTYSWVSDFNLKRHFNEFCFKIKRLQNKKTIFDNLITRMVNKEKVYQKHLICSYSIYLKNYINTT